MAKHNEIGSIGESIAVKFLMKKGLKIVEQNYWRKWGEIDIVACDTSKVIHFIEVKSTSRDYTGNTSIDNWNPEEMLHSNKIKRLRRVIQTYIIENGIEEWVFDVIVVYLNKRTRIAKCKYIKDIVI